MIEKLKIADVRETIETLDEINKLTKKGYFINSKDGVSKNKTITLSINTRMLSLNDIYGKDAVYGKSKLANEIKDDIYTDPLSSKLKIRGCKVDIEFEYLISNKAICQKTGKARNQRVYDIANYCGMNKMIEDALVKEGVLKDDSQKFVTSHKTTASKDYALDDGINIVKVKFILDDKSYNEYQEKVSFIFNNYTEDEIEEIRKHNKKQEAKRRLDRIVRMLNSRKKTKIKRKPRGKRYGN